jgi:MFS transporter, PHS family, inorganic phosphate transporter
MDHVLEIYALFMLLGIFTTLLIPETARKTLEELSGEDDYANNPETTIDTEAHAGKNERTSG